jgi:hypothetical protein
MKRNILLKMACWMPIVLSSLWLAGHMATVSTQLVPTGVITSADCKDGGWRQLTTRHGKTFKSQGECVSYFSR